MNRYKKLFSDTLVLAIGTFGSKLLVFFLMPLYTALLSPTQYSAAELITGTANLIMPFACMGITTGIFRFAAERNANREAVFSSSVALLGGGFALLLAVGVPIAIWGSLPIETVLVILYVLFADVQAVCAQYVRAIDRPRLFAVQGILNTVLTILCNLLFLIVFDLGVTGYVLAVIVGNLLTTVFLVVVARLWRVFRVTNIQKSVMRELFRFSLPMVPTTICWLITDLSDRYFVNAICGAEVNGIYSAAYKIPTVVTLVSGIFMQAWQFSAVAESADDETCGGFYSKVFKGYLSVVFFGAAALIVASPLLCDLLLNEAYGEARRYMPTLLCAAALESIVSFLATVYLVKKKSLHSFLTAVTGTLLNLCLNALLIPRIGALGAAVATFLGYGVVYILRLWDAPRLLRFRLYLPRQIVGVALLVAMASAMTFAPSRPVLWALPLLAVLVAVEMPALLQTAKELLHHRRGRGAS